MDPQVNNPNQAPNPAPAPQFAPQPGTAQPAPEPSTIETVPATWPGAFGLYKHSKAAVKPNVWSIVGLYALSFLVTLVLQATLKNVGTALSYVVSTVISVATLQLIFAGIRGEHLSFGDALKRAQPMLVVKYFVNYILLGLALLASFILLIVPFFFVLPRLMLAPYLVIDRDLGPVEAISQSWALTKGHAGMIWGVIGASIAMALLMITIIGIPFAIYFLLMYSAGMPIAYLFLARQQPAEAAAPPAPAAPAAPFMPAV